MPLPDTNGIHRVPGDKSITHRALMLAGLASGRSRIEDPLVSLDIRSTARVLRALGTGVSQIRPGKSIVVDGAGLVTPPGSALQAGNSGTTTRLLMGLLAARPFKARIVGDRSLSRRPMRRVTEPLGLMGASFEGKGDTLPITMWGGALRSIEWESPVASAQVKGAILLAGAAGGVPVAVREPVTSRDHTERMLESFGFRYHQHEGWLIQEPTGWATPFELKVPGDPSSAAFLVAAALLGKQGSVRLEGVGLNPTRTGFLRVLGRMLAGVQEEEMGTAAGEPIGALEVSPARLRATIVSPEEVPSMIDEIPILACLAARAEGESRFDGLGELRHKESDRLELIAINLRTLGVEAEVSGDSLSVIGTDRPLRGKVVTRSDHRIAMAFAVLGIGQQVVIDNPDCAAVSFFGFDQALSAVVRETE